MTTYLEVRLASDKAIKAMKNFANFVVGKETELFEADIFVQIEEEIFNLSNEQHLAQIEQKGLTHGEVKNLNFSICFLRDKEAVLGTPFTEEELLALAAYEMLLYIICPDRANYIPLMHIYSGPDERKGTEKPEDAKSQTHMQISNQARLVSISDFLQPDNYSKLLQDFFVRHAEDIYFKKTDGLVDSTDLLLSQVWSSNNPLGALIQKHKIINMVTTELGAFPALIIAALAGRNEISPASLELCLSVCAAALLDRFPQSREKIQQVFTTVTQQIPEIPSLKEMCLNKPEAIASVPNPKAKIDRGEGK